MKIVNLLGGIIMLVLILPAEHGTAQTGDDLIAAVAYQDLDKVKELINAGVDINYQTEMQAVTALIMACQYNFVDIGTYLIEAGADFTLKMNTGHNALMAAASMSKELFDLLVSKGADTSVKLEDGTSAFTISVSGALSGHIGLEIAKTLLDKGADVDEAANSGPTEGYTCLMMAAGNQRPDIVKFLVEEGANLNAKAGDGTTPLSMAEKRNDPEMVALLKELGAE